MKQFVSMIGLEFIKLRRTALLWVGIATGIGSIAISLYISLADKMTEYTFDIFAGNVIHNNMSLFFPFTAVLTVGYMMEQERTCCTLRTILSIPVTFRKLLTAKLAAGMCFTASYSILQWILSLFTCSILQLSGLDPVSAIVTFGMMLVMNLCVYIAVLPVIALSAQYKGGYMAGVGFAVFYGFCSVFTAGHGFTAVYPISAGLVLLKFDMAPTIQETINAASGLSLMLALTIILTLTSYDRTEK